MNQEKEKKKKNKKVDEASRESFPASDPPSHWASGPKPTKKAEKGKEPSSQDRENEKE